MEGLVMAAQIILSLSILVGLHELGHLIAAKAFGMRVEQYSIGFPPKIFGVKYGETEYSVGAIPLGGYVKISGMIDESLDTKAMKEAPKDYEFRAKPAWQRLIVMMGGIVVNIITGVFIFINLVYFYGDDYISMEQVNKSGIVAYDLGQGIGFETGDKILTVNGEIIDRFEDIFSPVVLLSDNSYYTVQRNGVQVDIPIPSDLIERLSDKSAKGNFISPRMTFLVGTINEGTEAERIGLQTGDRFISIGGTSVNYFDEFEMEKRKYANRTVDFKVQRQDKELILTANLDADAYIGFGVDSDLELSHKDYTFGESIVEGNRKAFFAIWINAKALAKIFKGEMNPSKSLMGPIRIATEIFGGTWNWQRFWGITGLLSMVLAFMNFLPIPALDGGHVMFLTFEIISGRKPSDKFLVISQKLGMAILLLLMAFVIFNDIFRTDVVQNLLGN